MCVLEITAMSPAHQGPWSGHCRSLSHTINLPQIKIFTKSSHSSQEAPRFYCDMNQEYMSNWEATDIVGFKYVWRYSIQADKLFAIFTDNRTGEMGLVRSENNVVWSVILSPHCLRNNWGSLYKIQILAFAPRFCFKWSGICLDISVF